MDARKKIKLTTETTLRDIELLEDFWSTIPLCNKHKGEMEGVSERDLMTMYFICKDCDKEYQNQNNAARRIEGKLAHEYWKLSENHDKEKTN